MIKIISSDQLSSAQLSSAVEDPWSRELKNSGYSLNILGNNLKIIEKNFPTFYQQAFNFGLMTVAPFVIGGVLMMIFALQGFGAFAFIYLLIGMLAIPGLFLTRSIYKKIYYKKNPTIEVYADLYVDRTLCPKCFIGKIKYSKLFNNHSECGFFGFYGQIRFICLECKTVYPEPTLSKYFGDDPTFKYYRRGKSYFK